MGASILAIWVLFATSIQSLAINRVDPILWARDAITYLLIAAAVVIGIDAASTMSRKYARTLTILIGVVSAIGFSYVWTQSRGYATGDEPDRAFLSSLVATTLPIALCFALGLAGKRLKPWWVALAALMIVAVLITGTRTGVVLGVVLLGMVGAATKERVSIAKLLLGLIVGGAAIVVAVPIAAGAFSSASDVQIRLQSIGDAIQGGFGLDKSGAIRLRATNYAMEVFRENPLVGQGLGVLFPNPNPGQQTLGGFSLDTPAMYFAKFGIVGVSALLVAFVLIIYAAVRHTPNTPRLLESTAGRGAVLAWIALLPLASTTEDKGFALSVALLMALVGSASRHAGRCEPNEQATSPRALTRHSVGGNVPDLSGGYATPDLSPTGRSGEHGVR
ncbi:hypothetical protein RM52_04065 [Microbacterium hominis]|uniref:O-antigen ligase-related domain-containing protein n=1 Tax=Microbacterium hominis TaxID=162426 RepID=A0A0B4CYB4_9MICO|nr:hypothetical protein RM52_04065 [Microbacterium hominis]